MTQYSTSLVAISVRGSSTLPLVQVLCFLFLLVCLFLFMFLFWPSGLTERLTSLRLHTCQITITVLCLCLWITTTVYACVCGIKCTGGVFSGDLGLP